MNCDLRAKFKRKFISCDHLCSGRFRASNLGINLSEIIRKK
ncbi:hypothetical protein [Campylobacter showae]|uniref:Uncharacterized protein n=1 Tax=Campylobacter showae RM3277 TaxID=553219 RepID=C6RI24_9BACT|nr:hypothetical protein [Campylobacter showae]EET79054.1 hypothetical protein CAMSH0001_1134 [Campylobacter showae RM3277]